jgi:glycosyltransferase involved in cell wall biosynthesis
MIVMTEELLKYFKSLGQKNILHLPMSVDHERFSNVEIKKGIPKYFAYCGGGDFERDGVYEIVKAFIDFNSTYPDYELHIIGGISNGSPYLRKIIDRVNESNLNDKIKFLGKKPSDEIPQLLFNAHCLLLAPTENFKSGGFPTKLGEYLATGVPVICTKVSEITNYLNSESALLIEPGNQEQLVNAMKRIEYEKNTCRKIGLNGQKIARKYFSIENYVLKLIQFLKLN